MHRCLAVILSLVGATACVGKLGARFVPGADGGPDVDLGSDPGADPDADGGTAPGDPPDQPGDDPLVPPDDPGPTDECGDVRTARVVYYGTAEPTVMPLLPGQAIAIGTFGGCSGTIIAPTWVLTATHCGLRGGAEFCVGERADDPSTCMGSLRAYDNPAGDMTLVELDRDARQALPALVPIPILTDDMDQGWIGRTAEAAGYGQQEDGGYGEREFTAEPIVSLDADDVTIDGEGRHGVCFGDSGGPVMAVGADGSARVAGNLSNGDGSCVGRDHYTRVDVHRAWIEEHTGPTLPPEGCGTTMRRSAPTPAAASTPSAAAMARPRAGATTAPRGRAIARPAARRATTRRISAAPTAPTTRAPASTTWGAAAATSPSGARTANHAARTAPPAAAPAAGSTPTRVSTAADRSRSRQPARSARTTEDELVEHLVVGVAWIGCAPHAHVVAAGAERLVGDRVRVRERLRAIGAGGVLIAPAMANHFGPAARPRDDEHEERSGEAHHARSVARQTPPWGDGAQNRMGWQHPVMQ